MFDETGEPDGAEAATAVEQPLPPSKRAKRRRLARAKQAAAASSKPPTRLAAENAKRSVTFRPQVIGIASETLQITPSAARLATTVFASSAAVAVGAPAATSGPIAEPEIAADDAQFPPAQLAAEPAPREPDAELTSITTNDAPVAYAQAEPLPAESSPVESATPLIDEASLDRALIALIAPFDPLPIDAPSMAPDAGVTQEAPPQASNSEPDADASPASAARPDSVAESRPIAAPEVALEKPTPLPARPLAPRRDLRLVAAAIAIAGLLPAAWFAGIGRSGETVQTADASPALSLPVASPSPSLPLVATATLPAEEADPLPPSAFDEALRPADPMVALVLAPSGQEQRVAREPTKVELAALRPPPARKPVAKIAAAKPPAATAREVSGDQVERRTLGGRIADFFSGAFSD